MQNFAKETKWEENFKPMQVKKKYETYDINKDQKFLYARELLISKKKRHRRLRAYAKDR